MTSKNIDSFLLPNDNKSPKRLNFGTDGKKNRNQQKHMNVCRFQMFLKVHNTGKIRGGSVTQVVVEMKQFWKKKL